MPTVRVGSHVEKLEYSYFAGRNVIGAASLGTSSAVPQVLNIELAYDSVIPISDVYPGPMKTYIYTKLVYICSQHHCS